MSQVSMCACVSGRVCGYPLSLSHPVGCLSSSSHPLRCSVSSHSGGCPPPSSHLGGCRLVFILSRRIFSVSFHQEAALHLHPTQKNVFLHLCLTQKDILHLKPTQEYIQDLHPTQKNIPSTHSSQEDVIFNYSNSDVFCIHSTK